MVNERFVDTFRAQFMFAIESALVEKVLIGWPSALLNENDVKNGDHSILSI